MSAHPAQPTVEAGAPQLLRDDPEWYRDAIIYQLHVKAFRTPRTTATATSPAAGRALDYIADAGRRRPSGCCRSIRRRCGTTATTSPPSPRSIPSTGRCATSGPSSTRHTARHLKVITELVINHTSDQHPWFRRVALEPQEPEARLVRVERHRPEVQRRANHLHRHREQSNWTWDQESQQYYWHRFFSHQPDLNFDNPQVAQGGDAGHALLARPRRRRPAPGRDARTSSSARARTARTCPRPTPYSGGCARHMDARYEGRMLLAEANQWPPDVLPYFGSEEEPECHMAFHFPLMPRIWIALRRERSLSDRRDHGAAPRTFPRPRSGRSSCATTTS